MSETMVERVATAIFDEWSKNISSLDFRQMARAAIEAMREPTALEKLPGVQAYLKVEGTCRPVAFLAGWNAVIDAALSPATSNGEK